MLVGWMLGSPTVTTKRSRGTRTDDRADQRRPGNVVEYIAVRIVDPLRNQVLKILLESFLSAFCNCSLNGPQTHSFNKTKSLTRTAETWKQNVSQVCGSGDDTQPSS